MVVGEVITVRPHPNGERIWLAHVNVGREFEPQIVWGGKQLVKKGSFVPVALPGARLPMGKIRRRRYRGQISEGMLCSLAELGWDPSVHDRVALLDDSADLKPGDPLDDVGSDWRRIVLQSI